MEAFIIRLDQQAHFLATERRYYADDKIKIAKVRDAVKGTLLTITATEIAKENASWGTIKDLNAPESESGFAGNVRFHRSNSQRSPTRSASPF